MVNDHISLRRRSIAPSRNEMTEARAQIWSTLLIAFVSITLCLSAKAQETDALMLRGRANARCTLLTGIAQGKMVFIGKGGANDGQVNPTLVAHEGDVVQVTLINGEGAEHDIVFPDVRASSQRIGPGASSTLVFKA